MNKKQCIKYYKDKAVSGVICPIPFCDLDLKAFEKTKHRFIEGTKKDFVDHLNKHPYSELIFNISADHLDAFYDHDNDLNKKKRKDVDKRLGELEEEFTEK